MAIAQDVTSAFARPDTLVDDWHQLGSSEDWRPGLRIGPYRLKERLGRGGMGVVWLAEQLQPLQRDVALKVMAADGRDGLAETWFEIERQALAQLSHPCVAQIFDAGRLPDGALFFAMEYVPGLPLDEFQAQHRLDYRELASLFMRICAGVQHAHQRGLIHRDLKPLNVLVRMLDGGPAPKIIDFGIAVSALTGVAAPFRVDRVIGTPAYMSLEQRSPGPEGIDARCDIYALGVMLGEALARAGGEAVTRDGIDVSVVHDAVRLELGQGAFDPGRDSRQVRARLHRCPRELLSIALKAMAVDREQRYESAAAMAEDLGRWLDRRPVRAVGNARLYVLRCLVQRNRVASLALLLISLAVLAGSAMAVYGMTQARKAQALAEQRRDDAERLIQFMLGDFADKLRPIGRLDLLDSIGQEALRYLGSTDVSDAAGAFNRARALRTLGEVQVTRQQFDQASETLALSARLLATFQPDAREAQPDWRFESGQVEFQRASIHYRLRNLPTAEEHFLAYLMHSRELSRLEPARGDAEVVYALTNLGVVSAAREQFGRAREYYLEAIERRRNAGVAPGDQAALDLADAISWLASAEDELGRPQVALKLAQQALDMVVEFGRRNSGNASGRQREINYRLVVAQLAQALGQARIAAEQLDRAFALAGEDVAVDPTQPRRRVMLARIAYSRVRLLPTGDPQIAALLDAGDLAIAALTPDKIAAQERLLLDALQCLARLRQPQFGSACARQILARLLEQQGPSVDRFKFAERSVELLLELAARPEEPVNELRPPVESLLESVPAARRGKLRFLQLELDLLRRFSPADPRVADLEARTRALLSPP